MARTLLFLAVFVLFGPASAVRADSLTPLSERDVAAYAAAFAAAERGDAPAREEAMAAVEDRLLEGFVLREALIAQGRTPDYPALADWLERFGDLPGADRVHQAALALRPADAPAPRAPQAAPQRRAEPSPLRPAYRPNAAAPGATAAERERNRAAALAFFRGELQEAQRLAEAELDGGFAGHARWTAGLAAFRLGQYAAALEHFEQGAYWPHGDDWQRAAHFFWAGRAAEALGEAQRAEANFRRAGEEPFTFYGLLARERLGLPAPVAMPSPATLSLMGEELVRRRPMAERAAALAQIGRTADAEAALMRAWAAARPEDDLAFLGLAEALSLPGVQQRIAERGGDAALAGAFPLPRIQPHGGFRLDRALIFAIIRQESRFDARAVSRAGARGLMQLMPSTAAWMADDPRLREQPGLLFDPALNLALGQAYLEKLLNGAEPAGCLIAAAMAYNSGPNAFARWRATWTGPDDPLLILESYPIGESRIYAEKVLSNLWLYHRRLGQPAPSLVALAQGRTPLYQPVERALLASMAASEPEAAPLRGGS
jgi:soluble lytic murein transglycosylase